MVKKKEARELLRRYLVEMNEKQTAENIHELLSDDFVCHQPGNNIVGLEGFKDMFRKLFAERKLHLKVEDLIIAGDKVVTRWTSRTTSKAGGDERVTAEITIDLIRDGKFAETWHMWSDKPWLK
jgi:predicted ester cyclase